MTNTAWSKEKVKDEEIYERCVVCGEMTGWLKSIHIDFRADYVEGVGQKCFKCARK